MHWIKPWFQSSDTARVPWAKVKKGRLTWNFIFEGIAKREKETPHNITLIISLRHLQNKTL